MHGVSQSANWCAGQTGACCGTCAAGGLGCTSLPASPCAQPQPGAVGFMAPARVGCGLLLGPRQIAAFSISQVISPFWSLLCPPCLGCGEGVRGVEKGQGPCLVVLLRVITWLLAAVFCVCACHCGCCLLLFCWLLSQLFQLFHTSRSRPPCCTGGQWAQHTTFLVQAMFFAPRLQAIGPDVEVSATGLVKSWMCHLFVVHCGLLCWGCVVLLCS